MVDHNAVGHVAAPFDLWVERGKVAEFARAIGATDPAHFEAEGAIAPATFLWTMAFWMENVPGADGWAAAQMNPARGLHAEQTYEFFGPPPRAGDRLTARSRIERIHEKASRKGGTLTFVDLVTDFHDADGRLVARAKLTGVETGEAPDAP
jgi:hypothetical protein